MTFTPSVLVEIIRSCHIKGRAVAPGDVVEVTKHDGRLLAIARRAKMITASPSQLASAATKAIGVVLVELGMTAEPGTVEKFVASLKGKNI
jgi:hypothetical protein